MPDTITAKALREKRLPLAKRIEELREAVTAGDGREFTAEERTNWEAVNKDYDTLSEQIKIAERAEQVNGDQGDGKHPGRDDYNGKETRRKQERETRLGEKREKRKARLDARAGWLRSGVTEEERCQALQAWCRAQEGLDLKWYHEEAAKKCGINPRARNLDLRITRDYRQVRRLAGEQRALSAQITTSGAATVPEGFVQNLEIALLDYANVRDWADVMRTDSGQDLPWPTVNDTTTKGKRIVENATVTEADVIFGVTMLHAYKYTSGMVQVPVELMEDSAFDLAATLGELFGIRIGRIQADDFTTGIGGAGQPQGYVTGATSGFTAASSTAIAADDLYNLKHSVDPAYRRMKPMWTFHDKILLAIKLLKDGLGRYLWQAGLAAGKPDTIDGDPYGINQSMSSTISSGKKTVVYGAMKKFKIRDVSAIRMRRLVERYADSDQEGFVMFMRSDAQLLDAGTHPIKYLVH